MRTSSRVVAATLSLLVLLAWPASSRAWVYQRQAQPVARCWHEVTTQVTVDAKTPQRWTTVKLPFAFPFFDVRSDVLRVHLSGFVQLELQPLPESTKDLVEAPLDPDTVCRPVGCKEPAPFDERGARETPDHILAPLWNDWQLDPLSSITVGSVSAKERTSRCGESAAEDVFVISFNDMVEIQGTVRASFQLQLSSNGAFAFVYGPSSAKYAGELAAYRRGQLGSIGFQPRWQAHFAVPLSSLFAQGGLTDKAVLAFEVAPSTPPKLDPFGGAAPNLVRRWAPDFY